MKTVTDAFTLAQSRKTLHRSRKVSYKRRSWNGVSGEYEWDSSWTDLAEDQIVSISPIAWAFDTQELSEFKVSNVNVKLRNLDLEWDQDTTGGKFDGYEPYWTKWRIQLGLILADGSSEVVTTFTGLTDDLAPNMETGDVTFNILGLEALLLNGNAEEYGTTVTLENLGTGNGSDTDFYTSQPGVGIIKTVKLDGTIQVEGVDYTTSDLNSLSANAKISFTDPVGSGVEVYATYVWWTQDVKGEDVVSALLTLGGVPSEDQSVSPVEFNLSVLNSVTYTSKTDFDTGTLTRQDSAISAGSLHVDWSTINLAHAVNWEDDVAAYFPFAGSWQQSGYMGSFAVYGQGWKKAFHQGGTWGYGVWQCDMKIVNSGGGTPRAVWAFDADYYFNGYSIDLENGTVYLCKNLSESTIPDRTHDLASASYTQDSNYHTWKVSVSSAGRIRVWFDGTLKIDYTDGSWTYPSVNMTFGYAVGEGGSGTTNTLSINNIYIPVDNFSDNSWVSPVIDCGAAPTALGVPTVDFSAGGTGSYAIYARSSVDGSTNWSSWYGLNSWGWDAALPLRQHYEIKIVLNVSISGVTASDPELQKFVFKYATASTEIQLPNMTGKNIYDAISAMAKFANYEFGFDSEGKFFFRPRVTDGDVVATLTNAQIMSISGYSNGWDRVYSYVSATYGAYTKYVEDDGTTADGPKARFSSKRLDVSADSSYVISQGADVATGVAQQFYNFVSIPRRRFKAQTVMQPQIDLGDIVQVVYGSSVNMKCRTVGVRHNPEEWTSEIDFEEIAYGPFLPNQLTELLSWFRADRDVYQDDDYAIPCTTDGQNVVGWKDQAVGAFHMIGYGSGAYKPTLVMGAVNGRPAVRFSQANTTYMLTDKVSDLELPVTAFLIGKSGGGTGGGYIITASRSYYWAAHLFYADYDNMSSVWCHETAPQVYIDCEEIMDTDWHVWNMVAEIPNGTIQQDDGTPGTTSGIYSDCKLGNGGDSWGIGYGFSMDIAEMIVYNRKLSADEIAQVKDYLKLKYDL